MDYLEEQFRQWGDMELVHLVQGVLDQSCSPEFHQELRTCTNLHWMLTSHYFYSQEHSHLPSSLQRCCSPCSPAEKMTTFPHWKLSMKTNASIRPECWWTRYKASPIPDPLFNSVRRDQPGKLKFGKCILPYHIPSSAFSYLTIWYRLLHFRALE